jgi:ketosteroid isomerase-like protein
MEITFRDLQFQTFIYPPHGVMVKNPAKLLIGRAVKAHIFSLTLSTAMYAIAREHTSRAREPATLGRLSFSAIFISPQGEQFMSTEDEVRNASEQFYAALNRLFEGDASPMTDIWSHGKSVTTMHPLGGREVGWDEFWKKWEEASGAFSGGQVKLGDQLIQIAGDIAYEVGMEQGAAMLAGEEVSIEQRVTNIYSREASTWKIVHHHADVSPSMMDIHIR